MRILALILILAISAQPLQAGHCGMDMGQGSGDEMMQHMDMGDGDDHGCCDTGADMTDGCSGGFHCGPCATVVPLAAEFPRIAPSWQRTYVIDTATGVVLPSHATPPYRPPIS